MTTLKVLIVIIVLGVVGVFAYDGVKVVGARRDVSNAASAAASAAAQAISSSGNTQKASAVAQKTAKADGDVLTSFNWDPVKVKVTVTVSGKADSLVLHYFAKGLTDDIHSSASARPG